MSRAFIKDDEDKPEPDPVAPTSRYPHYVTPAELARLREALESARKNGDAKEIASCEEHLESAIVVDPALQPRDVVAFGATVTVVDERGAEQRYTIVGEDGADPVHGTIAWISPLAEALLDQRVGDTVTWHRPIGDAQLRIVRIAYQT
jgi:transcription elongation GreA/GreB family factor